MSASEMTRLAYFVSPHGFGHAARASAVMSAVHARRPDVHFDIFTLTPEWFFADSLGRGYSYHALPTDVGLAQVTPIHADLDETMRRLDVFLPFDRLLLTRLADWLRAAHVPLVLCDVSPLGLAVAEAAGVPSVLIENFTWDWIYAGYFDQMPRLRAHVAALSRLFATATYRFQTEPFCTPWEGATRTSPVARPLRASSADVRRQLGLPPGARYVVITMGGVTPQYGFLEQLAQYDDNVWFVVPGGSDHWEHRGHLVLLPHHSPIYHPDLVGGADAVIGKLGYSTLAEAYRAGTPYGFIRRPGFRESDVLATYALTYMESLEISEAAFESGEWEGFLQGLLALPRRTPDRPNGADEVAAFVAGQLPSHAG